jgi:hypothetical protein
MPERKITLRGDAARGSTVSATVLRDLLDVMIDGCQRSTRLQYEGRSSARGPIPRWLEAAAAFDVKEIRAGSTQIVVEAPPLLEAAPEFFAQGDVLRPLRNGASALDLFHDGLRDAIAGELDSDSFDAPLLKTYGKLKRVLAQGFDEVVFGDVAAITVDATALDSIKQLRSRVPDARHVRVAGKLEQIQHSNQRFILVVAGSPVRGVADESISPTQLASLFGQHVIATGDAIFRPSGSLLRLDAMSLERAGKGASAWEKLPRPLFEASKGPSPYRMSQTPKTGLGAIMGRWPGEESDEELAAALEASA